MSHLFADGDSLAHSCPIPPGCVPVRVVEVLQFMNEDGQMENAVRWEGTRDIVTELGMLEFAKLQITQGHFQDGGERA